MPLPADGKGPATDTGDDLEPAKAVRVRTSRTTMITH